MPHPPASLLFSLLLFSFISMTQVYSQTCGGNIIRGCSGPGCFLDPDGDGDIVNASSGFSNCGIAIDEMVEFEDLRNPTGCSTCQRPWIAIPAFQEEIGDLWAGGASCGNTEIAPVSASDGTYAYYCIVDPDGVCENGDELLIFRIRTATSANGSFSYSLLIDTDGLVGAADPDGIQCASKVANSGFEYEVIANPGNNKNVEVIDINGTVGSGTLVTAYDNDVYYNQSNACRSACGCNGGSVYHTFAIELTQIGKSCSDQNFLFAGGTASSGNGTISSNTSVSDVGGINIQPSCPDSTVACNCCEECEDTASAYYCSGNTSTCLMACLNSCIATINGGSTSLPVEFTDFSGAILSNEVQLNWTVASEENNDYYEIQRSNNGADFIRIGTVGGFGTTNQTQFYEFIDHTPQKSQNYYRIKQVDYDGTYSFSKTITLEFSLLGDITVYPTIVNHTTSIGLNTPYNGPVHILINDINGRAIKSFVRPAISGYNKIEVNTSDFNTGVYFIRVQHNSIQNILRIIKT